MALRNCHVSQRNTCSNEVKQLLTLSLKLKACSHWAKSSGSASAGSSASASFYLLINKLYSYEWVMNELYSYECSHKAGSSASASASWKASALWIVHAQK